MTASAVKVPKNARIEIQRAPPMVDAAAGPFLFNALMTFSHMNLSTPLTRNIADLRGAKSEHHDKSTLLEYDVETDEERNDTKPGVFQKTVTKILQKLQFLAQLVNSGFPIADVKTNTTSSAEDESSVEVVDVGGNATESGRFSLTKVFESVIDLVTKMG
ncbi:hypothetical protein FQR65_LT13467 [Abscondita terminalis]|nr:hypothetical protein FQR65_LT13467 [Abscondita terminalis]